MKRLALLALLALPASAQERRSGFEDMARETQAMQRDDTNNPGMLWVLEGEALFERPAGPDNRSCASCHHAAALHGTAARYPAWDTASGAPMDLAGRIQQCRTERQNAAPMARESQGLLALTSYVAHQSRGLPIEPPSDPRLAPSVAAGERLYRERIGQLDLACTQCHDDQAGRRLAGNAIPEAHPTGYPIYRLEWQGMGSLARRIRGCMTGVRAEPFADGALETVELELFLKRRAAGMPLETPAVRP